MSEPRMPAWNDRQISRFSFRESLFTRRGLTPADAETLADELAFRDFDYDDRRVCVECKNWQRGNTCSQSLPTSMTQLARCHGFKFVTP